MYSRRQNQPKPVAVREVRAAVKQRPQDERSHCPRMHCEPQDEKSHCSPLARPEGEVEQTKPQGEKPHCF